MRSSRTTIYMSVLLVLVAASISAQTFLMNPMPEDRPKISLRFMHPIFKTYYGPDERNLSGEYQIGLHIPLNARFNVVALIPVFRGSYEFLRTNEVGAVIGKTTKTEYASGNIYVGVQYLIPLSQHTRSSISAGLYCPTAKQDYQYYATLYMRARTNPIELRSWLSKALVFYANYAVRMESSGSVGGIFGIEAGPEAFIPTFGADPEILAHYGLSAGIRVPYITVFGELLGLAIITSDFGNFAERFDHFVAFGAHANNWPIRPGVFYQIPLDDEYRYSMKGVLGVKLDVVLP